MVGVAALGSFVGMRQLDTAIAAENRGRLDAAKGVFDLLRTRALGDMRELGRILADDTRLRSALATMDKATIADSLADLSKLRGSGIFVVLTPEGRVLAEAGAPELRELDLSASKVVKEAKSSTEVVVGSWVIGNKIIDLEPHADPVRQRRDRLPGGRPDGRSGAAQAARDRQRGRRRHRDRHRLDDRLRGQAQGDVLARPEPDNLERDGRARGYALRGEHHRARADGPVAAAPRARPIPRPDRRDVLDFQMAALAVTGPGPDRDGAGDQQIQYRAS